MPLFQIIPTVPAGKPIEVEASDAAGALYVISSRGLGDVDVWSDEQYVFSAKLQGSDSPFFAIYQREELGNGRSENSLKPPGS